MIDATDATETSDGKGEGKSKGMEASDVDHVSLSTSDRGISSAVGWRRA